MPTIQQLRRLIAQMREHLQRGDHEHLPELVRQYLDQVHAACTDADFCPATEPLRQLLAEHQQVMAQMREQRQVLMHAMSTHRESARATRAYLSTSA